MFFVRLSSTEYDRDLPPFRRLVDPTDGGRVFVISGTRISNPYEFGTACPATGSTWRMSSQAAPIGIIASPLSRPQASRAFSPAHLSHACRSPRLKGGNAGQFLFMTFSGNIVAQNACAKCAHESAVPDDSPPMLVPRSSVARNAALPT